MSAELSEQAGDHTLLSGNLSLMGLAALDENGEEAEALILRGLAESQNLGDRAGIWNRGVVGVAGLLARRGFYEESARLLGTAERVREDNKIGFGVLSERFQAGVVVELERHLGEPICRRLWEEGRRNADEAALTDALRHLD